MSATTINKRTEIKRFAREARQSLRDMQAAIDDGDLSTAIDYANQAVGCCGECENLLRDQDEES